MMTMNLKNVAIPAILTTTVLVAGVFAYMPVEKVSTVHTAILQKQINVNEGDTVSNAAGKVTIVADSSLIKRGFVCIKTTDAGGANDADLELALEDDLGLVIDLLDSTTMEDAGGECVEFVGFRLELDQGGAGDTVSFVAMWQEESS